MAGRMRRPSWRDPRLGIGIVLVALSVAFGIWAVASAGSTIPVWSASRTITPGETFQGAVTAVEVSPNLADTYLHAAEQPEGVADRVVAAGELVPASAVVPVNVVDLRAVVVPVGTQLSAAVTAGSHVDLWLTPDDGSEARLVLGDLVVRGLVENDSAFVSAMSSSVEVLVATDAVGVVLTAMNDGGPLVVVPRSGE